MINVSLTLLNGGIDNKHHGTISIYKKKFIQDIAEQFPEEFALRDMDKLNYRYPQVS